jgi:hypothetical protein
LFSHGLLYADVLVLTHPDDYDKTIRVKHPGGESTAFPLKYEREHIIYGSATVGPVMVTLLPLDESEISLDEPVVITKDEGRVVYCKVKAKPIQSPVVSSCSCGSTAERLR